MITASTIDLKGIYELARPLTDLKGIGPRRAQLLGQKGLHTLMDLLLFMPIRYEDRRKVLPIGAMKPGLAAWVRGTVISGKEEKFFRSGKRLFRIMIEDGTGALDLLWFQYKKFHLTSIARNGLKLLAYGRIQPHQGKPRMVHPEIVVADSNREENVLGVYPVYSAIEGISRQVLRSAIGRILNGYETALVETVPREITRALGLPGISETIRCVHSPPEDVSIDLLNEYKTKYQQRLTFNRFFKVMLGVALRKKARKTRRGPKLSAPGDIFSQVRSFFPFALTGDQVKAIRDVLRDVSGEEPMSRLLQGDVGCGKTVIAAVASFVATRNNRQVAVMVPTQVLARQHYRYFTHLAERMGFRSVLLTGALKKSERLRVYEKIAGGHYNLIVGTQALIQQDLFFANLGLVVIDEQHRFGVRQRALLDQKGVNPHLLVMTATPIPRTLAMTVYADLDISFIREYPEGHQPVVTRLMHGSRKRVVYNTLKQRMTAGEQAMVICPVIEKSEETDLKNALEMHEKLKKIFAPRFRLGLIHGRMSGEEKERIMEQFEDGRIHLLVGTTVIEVGIHAPGATVMVIQHPERFGLTQLHQLRGRVGRGHRRGCCFLMIPSTAGKETLSRLEILARSSDGFEIARKDLEIRGQGELMGVRQAGAGELDLMEMLREPELLLEAKKQADALVDSDPTLSKPGHRRLKRLLQGTPDRRLDL